MDQVIPEKTKQGFDEQKAEFIAYLVARGSSIRDACKAAKCGRKTYYRWLDRHPDKMAEVARRAAESADIQFMAMKARRAMLDLLEDPEASASNRRQVAQWILSKADAELRDAPSGPQVDARQIHISTEALEALSLEELDAIEANPELVLDSHADE